MSELERHVLFYGLCAVVIGFIVILIWNYIPKRFSTFCQLDCTDTDGTIGEIKRLEKSLIELEELPISNKNKIQKTMGRIFWLESEKAIKLLEEGYFMYLILVEYEVNSGNYMTMSCSGGTAHNGQSTNFILKETFKEVEDYLERVGSNVKTFKVFRVDAQLYAEFDKSKSIKRALKISND